MKNEERLQVSQRLEKELQWISSEALYIRVVLKMDKLLHENIFAYD